ncbi:hypothetical protein A2U01_0033463, partial [Trifolium medium]|nr:hypothetical protein [Trifolium medium]
FRPSLWGCSSKLSPPLSAGVVVVMVDGCCSPFYLRREIDLIRCSSQTMVDGFLY